MALTINPQSGQHRSTCIFLHGLGDSGHGWSDVAMLLAKKLPFTKFILPHAPVQRVTLNGGMKMPAWYDLLGLSQNSPQDNAGILQSATSILKLVSEEASHGIKPSQIVIGGFSQGGAVALTTGLLYKSLSSEVKEDFAGIMALSTYLPIHEHFKEKSQQLAHNTPIVMFHGTADGVVSYQWGKQSAKMLKEELQCKALQFKSIDGMAHSVTPAEIDMMAEFMRQQLKE